MKTRTFEFEGVRYVYELDGYKPFCLCREDSGEPVLDMDVYDAATLDAAEYLQERKERYYEEVKSQLYAQSLRLEEGNNDG